MMTIYPLLTATSSAGTSPAGKGTIWLPEQASTAAERGDVLFYFIYYLSAFFFLLVVGLTVAFVLKYRRRRGQPVTVTPIEGSRRLEIAWSVVPAAILVGIFFWSFSDYITLSVPPAGALEVRVLAQKWSWSFDYPKHGIVGATELVVPQGRPVKLTMSAAEVIHSFYVPAFRIKKDVLPNRYTVTWFEATKLGSYDIFCTEYCGSGHSQMHALVKVVSTADFEQWAQTGGGPPDGKKLFVAKACATCHSVTTDRMGLPGPPLAGRFGQTETLSDGATLTIDDNYVRESIVAPMAKVVKGYTPVMPTFAGLLTDPQINALIDYIKTLK
ncbi:MAG: cytochrome c oxidase subunit II [Proteobacteria bacterium]|nr:cytochrome c oxidase subunit II [Pseudomonadota bacterium]